ncbi:arabinosyltransferase domain-containing protein [Amycolatopsis nigrescens]|uniref:arabinosyltransferase domain-containing protein n=1 Tax=Amycolatopsis nigrescens TaxID=381445 RepID=UPI0003759838|nr:arabinosyltransferase domain-containing protein [Amycolatopsis nigrescens]
MPPHENSRPWSGIRRWGIVCLGLLSALAAVLFVLAPVEQDIAKYEWQPGPGAGNTALPLMPYQPSRLDASFDCAQPRDGLLLATNPPPGMAGEQDAGNGLTVRADQGVLRVRLGDTQLADRPTGAGCRWHVRADDTGTRVDVNGGTLGHSPDRPSVTGLFTEGLDAGLHVQVVADTRFDSSAGVLKVVLGVLAVLSLVALLVLARRWDQAVARRVRLLPRRWWRPRAPDVVVAAALGGWSIIGALTVDDGYIVTMLKARAESGFAGNYFRWFNAPEAPFGWFYEMYRLLAEVSAQEVWLRLPSVLLGLVAWVLVDRVLLPRLTSGELRWTRWAAAALFLLWYLPFDVGLRPEPLIVVGSLVVFALVERALATGAVAPLAAGLVVAGATVAVTPTGVAAFLPFVAALSGLVRLLRRRGNRALPALLCLLLAAAASTLLWMFYDQTLGTVLAATDVRTRIGPAMDWQQEIERYATLLDPNVVEGSLNRRVPVLLTLFGMAVLGALLLRGRTPGLAAAACRRLAVCGALYLVALTFTPTKWTHHFGALAGFGTLLLALVVHTVARGALRSVRARAIALALLAGVTALAVSAPDSWWSLSELGVWAADGMPSILGFGPATLVLGVGLALAVAGALAGAWRSAGGAQTDDRRALRWLPATGPLLVLIALGTVVLEVGSMARAVTTRWDTYTVGRSNLASFGGSKCGIEDWLTVEPDPAAGVLRPAAGSAPARLEGMRDGGFPAGTEPLVRPAWGSYRSPDGSMTSAWYALPPDAGAVDRAPLVLGVAGTGDVQVRVEFGRADGEVLSSADVDVATEGKWRDRRLDPAETPGADRVRVLAEDRDEEGWVAVTAPRLPVVVPSAQFVPPSEEVAVDWPNAFLLPCRQPASLADGMVQPVRYRFAPGPDSQELAGLSYTPDAGGPYAPLVQLATEHPVPTYLRGDKLREPISVFRFDYPAPMRDLKVTRSTRPLTAFTRGGPQM